MQFDTIYWKFCNGLLFGPHCSVEACKRQRKCFREGISGQSLQCIPANKSNATWCVDTCSYRLSSCQIDYCHASSLYLYCRLRRRQQGQLVQGNANIKNHNEMFCSKTAIVRWNWKRRNNNTDKTDSFQWWAEYTYNRTTYTSDKNVELTIEINFTPACRFTFMRHRQVIL